MNEALYDRLGGADGIDAVVDEFYDRVLADESLAEHFEDADVEALHAHQRQFLAAATGGPDRYDGDDMAAAHDHLDITAEDFATVAGHLDDALAACGVAEADRDAVLERVGELEAPIVSD